MRDVLGPPSVDESLARLQELRLRAQTLIGDRLAAHAGRPRPARSVPDQIAAVRATVLTLRHQHEAMRGELEAERARNVDLEDHVRRLTADIETVLADLDAANHEIEVERSLHEQAISAVLDDLDRARAQVDQRDEMLRRLTVTADELRAQLDRVRAGVVAAGSPPAGGPGAADTTSLDELVERIERLKAQVRSGQDDV